MSSLVNRRALVAGLTLFAACADGPTQPDLALDPARNGKEPKAGGGGAGTTLVASKTANGFHEVRTEYDWSIEKRVISIMDEHMVPEPSTSATSLAPRTIKWIDYEIVATRTQLPTVTVAGVRGEICVTNAGERPTEGLAIRDVVQRKSGGSWVDAFTGMVDVSARPVLSAGEQHCYPYEFVFAATPGEYRNTAFVTITNHSGHLGTPFGPAFNGGGIKAGFSIGSSPRQVTLDATAHISDPAATNVPGSYQRGGCAALWPLFFCTAMEGLGSWFVDGPTTIEYMVDVGNLYACGDEFELKNTVALTESGSGDFGGAVERRFAHASIHIATPACPPATAPVRSASFWSQGTGWPPHQFWGSSFRLQDFAFFDTGLTWLQQARLTPRTTYERLAREYIATSLNMASGAPVTHAVREAHAAAGQYFSLWPEQRAAVPAASLEQWTSVLAAYNQGATP
jgi:hypothetical protein